MGIGGRNLFVRIEIRNRFPDFGRDFHNLFGQRNEGFDKRIIQQAAGNMESLNLLSCIVKVSEVELADG